MELELVVQRAGQVVARHALRPGARLVVGSGADAHCRIADAMASPRHVGLELRPDGLVAFDLNSDMGTTCGGRPVPPGVPLPLPPGAALEVGEHVLLVRAPAAPSMRDDYEPMGELGEGAAGKVFRARHRATGREVAIKLLHDQVGAEPGQRERFLREAAVCKRIQSPHVVAVHEARCEGPRGFLVMELVRGETLRDRILRGPVPVDEAVRIGLGIARGLQAAHAAGVIHRDVKPGNVLLTAEGAVKVADFGLAKDAQAKEQLTRTRQGMGTLAYLAPEQAQDSKRVDARADLYSLGATLFHTLTGRLPFTSTGMEVLSDIFDVVPPPVSELRPGCPPGLAALVASLLAKDPDDRPADAGVVVSDLLEQ